MKPQDKLLLDQTLPYYLPAPEYQSNHPGHSGKRETVADGLQARYFDVLMFKYLMSKTVGARKVLYIDEKSLNKAF
jgi:hypothetical protein